jgi:hypothetical protein
MCFLRSFLVSMTLAVVALAATLFAKPAAATVMLAASGSTSGANPVPIAAQAQLALSGTTLSVVLSNVSPGSSSSADQMLSSFYFDIVKNGIRPTLTYESSSGFVWKLISNAPDEPFNYTPPAVAGGPGTYTLATGTVAHVPSDLKAVKDNDRTWQFRSMNDASPPFLGFGIGTVANGEFGGGGGNGFTESIVGPSGPDFIAFSIYKNGDIQPVGAPVQNQFLVLNSATFTFSSAALADYTEADISPRAVFGFGTGPDTVLVVPEPGSLALLAAGGMLGGLAWLKRVRRQRRRGEKTPDGLTRCFSSSGLTRCLMTTVMITAVVIALLMTSGPAQATPIPVAVFDFSTGPQGWVATNAAYNNKPTPNTWEWSGGMWGVEPVAVLNDRYWLGNYLTSPVLVVPPTADGFEVTLLHRFRFPVNITTGQPVVAGQVGYRFFDPAEPNAPFLPLPISSFSTGPVAPPFDTKTPFPDWVPPTHIAPLSRLPLLPEGATWMDAAPGWNAGSFVASRFILDGGLPAGQQVQFRLINANLGLECSGGGWDVASVTVEGILPEPGGALLATVGGTLAGIAWRIRRGYQRASSPSDRPVTNTLPPVSVA